MSALPNLQKGSEWLHLFVPGRLCLFGEHSDWAGGYRREIAELYPGHCIAVGTDQGIHARVRKRDGILAARSQLPDSNAESLCMPLEPAKLQRIARTGGFWSYVTGTLHEVLCAYPIAGLEIRLLPYELTPQEGTVFFSGCMCPCSPSLQPALWVRYGQARGDGTSLPWGNSHALPLRSDGSGLRIRPSANVSHL